MNDAAQLIVLEHGLQQMGLRLPHDATTKLLAYVHLMQKWNQAYNLTAVRKVEKIIPVHILDSLSLLPFIADAATVFDVGTGAGLPGLPLAVALPSASFTLLDSQQKKINFVQQAVSLLQLPNVVCQHTRIEQMQISSPIDVIVSRAFASLGDFVKLIVNIADEQTKIVAMKGRQELVLAEQQQLPPWAEIIDIATVAVPDVDGERCLVFLKINKDKIK